MENVLYICPSVGVGGAETFLKQTFKYKTQNYQNHYLLFESGPLGESLSEMGAHVHYLNFRPRLRNIQDRKKVSNKIKELINTYNFKLVHSTMSYGALFAAWPCKQMQVPHVWFQHGPASGWMDRLAAVLPHQGLIVNSHHTAKKQRALENPLRFLIPRKIPIEKILLGTDEFNESPEEILKFRNSLSGQFQFPPSHLVITMLCRIQRIKGIHVLLDALKILKTMNLEEGFHAVIWGESFRDEGYLEELKAQVSSENLPVTFAGLCKQPSLALAASDFVVNASTSPEAFGLTVIEGMMSQCIPIVPNEGGTVETVSNGANGMIFKARNPDSLANSLKTLINDKNLREKLAAKARETAINKFTAKRAIGHLETFHQRIIDSGGKNPSI